MLKRDFYYDMLNLYKESTKKWEESKRVVMEMGCETHFYQSLDAIFPLIQEYDYSRDKETGLKLMKWNDSDNCFVVSLEKIDEKRDSFIDIRIYPDGIDLRNRKTYPNEDGIKSRDAYSNMIIRNSNLSGCMRDVVVDNEEETVAVYREFDNNSIKDATDMTNEFYRSLKLTDKVKYLKSVQDTEVLTVHHLFVNKEKEKDFEKKAFGI